MVREPLLAPAIVFAVGIVVAHASFSKPGQAWVPLVAATVAVALLLIAALKTGFEWRRKPLVLAAFLLFGIGTELWHKPGPPPELTTDDDEVVALEGCVIDPPVFSNNREQFTLELAPGAAARITVSLQDAERLALEYGDRVEMAAKIRLPRNYLNPASFDYKNYLARQHIYWNGSVRHPSEIKVAKDRCGSRLLAGLYNVRTWCLARLEKLYPGDPQTAGLLQAILLGATNAVDKSWTQDFRLTGTYHALVISGQHVAALIFVLTLVLRLCNFSRIAILISAAFTSWTYAFMSGMTAPVVRAAAGVTVALLAGYLFRRVRILNLLALISLIYLTFDPGQLFEASFQLSFLSAAAIAAFALPLLERYIDPYRSATKRFGQQTYDTKVAPRAAEIRTELRLLAETVTLWTNWSPSLVNGIMTVTVAAIVFAMEAMLVSACVQFGLALPMIAYFHRLSLTGLTANIFVVPLLSAVIPLGFAGIVTGWPWIASLTKLFLNCAETIASFHARFEPHWRIGDVPLFLSVGFAASLLLLAFFGRKQSRWTGLAFVSSLTLFVVLYLQPWPALAHAGQLELTAIDVSQGDSLLVTFPNGKQMLVDAGGFPGSSRMKHKPQLDVGEDVVSPYLWTRRIKSLDYAVLSHGHSDHMDGLGAVIDNFRPRELWVGAEPDTPNWRNVQKHARDAATTVKSLTSTAPPMNIGGAIVRVLAPLPDYVPGPEPHNDDSLVLEIAFGKQSILLTGDAERGVERSLVEAGTLHPVTILKVGHHGSKTSSTAEFLDAIQPRFALISDGYKNQFHHPHRDVVARLEEHKTKILRTDEHGLVTVRLDGNNQVAVETFQ